MRGLKSYELVFAMVSDVSVARFEILSQLVCAMVSDVSVVVGTLQN